MQTPVDSRATFPGYNEEQSLLAREWLRLSYAERDDEANAIVDKIEAQLGEKMCDRLLNLVEKESEQESPESTKTTSEDSDEDFILSKKMPGYAISKHIRVKDVAGGPGRKCGRIITPVLGWGKTRKGTYYMRVYFQITIDKKRKKVEYHNVLIERHRLIGERKHGKKGSARG